MQIAQRGKRAKKTLGKEQLKNLRSRRENLHKLGQIGRDCSRVAELGSSFACLALLPNSPSSSCSSYKDPSLQMPSTCQLSCLRTDSSVWVKSGLGVEEMVTREPDVLGGVLGSGGAGGSISTARGSHQPAPGGESGACQ